MAKAAAMNWRNLTVIGANYRSSSTALRQTIAANWQPSRDQALVLNTDERLEIIAQPDNIDLHINTIIHAWAKATDMTVEDLRPSTFTLQGLHAIRHVFALAATTDALIPGDERLAQSLITAAQRVPTTNPLHKLVTAAQISADEIERHTSLTSRPVTIAGAALRLMHDIHGPAKDLTMVVIGGDSSGKILTKAFVEAGVQKMCLFSKDEEVSAAIDHHQTNAPPPDFGHNFDKEHLIKGADILVTAVSQHGLLIPTSTIRSLLLARPMTPMLVLDVAIPGNVDRDVEHIDGVFLYDWNDLEHRALQGGTLNAQALGQADAMVHDNADRFYAGNIPPSRPDSGQILIDYLSRVGWPTSFSNDHKRWLQNTIDSRVSNLDNTDQRQVFKTWKKLFNS